MLWAGGIPVVLLVGWSRTYLGEPHPSDVGAGYASGFCWAYICLLIATMRRRGRTRKALI